MGEPGVLTTVDVAQRRFDIELARGDLVGEYEVESHLGAGGMGQVYAVVHPVIGKRAAVKILHPELSRDRDAVARFVQEARAVNQIGHPNIVDIFGFGSLADGRSGLRINDSWARTCASASSAAGSASARRPAILEMLATALEAAGDAAWASSIATPSPTRVSARAASARRTSSASRSPYCSATGRSLPRPYATRMRAQGHKVR